MKNLLLAAIIACLLALPTGLMAEEHTPPRPNIQAHVEGMTCEHCAQGLKKLFLKEDSVEKVEINFKNGEVLLYLKEGKALSDEEVTKVVKAESLKLLSIKRDEN